jgi:hypothetical protein
LRLQHSATAKKIRTEEKSACCVMIENTHDETQTPLRYLLKKTQPEIIIGAELRSACKWV